MPALLQDWPSSQIYHLPALFAFGATQNPSCACAQWRCTLSLKAEAPDVSIRPLCLAAALLFTHVEQAAQEQQGLMLPGTRTEGCTGKEDANATRWALRGPCLQGTSTSQHKKIMWVFPERDLLHLMPWTQAQLALQLDIKVREKAHKGSGEDQVGQSGANVLQMRCQDAGMS